MAEICVSNIPHSASEVDLKSLMETWFGIGAIVSCEIKRDPLQLQHKGYGFVTFVEHEKAEIAVCLAKEEDHDFVLQNRPLRIDFSHGASGSRAVEIAAPAFEAGALSLGWLEGSTFHVLWASNFDAQLEYDGQGHTLSLLVNVYRDTGLKQYKLEHTFESIYQLCLANIAGQGLPSALLFQLWNPPRVFKRMDEIDIWQQQDPGLSELTDLMQVLISSSGSQERWFRTVDFTPGHSIGQSLAYVVEFPSIERSGGFTDMVTMMRGYFDIPAVGKQLKLKARVNALPSQLLVPMLTPTAYQIPFKVIFKLNNLVQFGSLRSPLLSDQFFRLLAETPTEPLLWVMHELLFTERMIDRPVQWLREGLQRYNREARNFPSSALFGLDEGLIWVYRLLITPTRVYCMGPEVETSNRVTRQYNNLLENFIRVTFVEEDGGTLPSAAMCFTNLGRMTAGFQVGRSDIHDRISQVLKDGFFLGGKKYEFLAFSSSQLREQSVWMFASDGEVTAESIRSWMGDFLEIRNVAKCAARMGQCFASSTKTFPVQPNEVQHLQDVFTSSGADRYCFSDGIGQICVPFATTVAKRCGCKRIRGRLPSAFQIRYGGYKGVVAVNPRSEYKLSLRPSMRKFESKHHLLEVLSWTTPLPCYLNRQVITLLSTLGVQDRVFEQMQLDVVSRLDELLNTREAAIEVLQATSNSGSHATALDMLASGYSPRSEPYLRSLLEAFRASKIGRIRSKARILVPKGRCLMGCLDETAILAYGEVFLQVSSTLGTHRFMDDGLGAFWSAQNGAHVVTGPVVVAKNPCLHPGDIRVLIAVDNSQLRHMVDCLVFPQRGHRPHPSECSGSDLDGDLYFVSWDQLLIPPTTDPPMNYTPAKEATLNRPVTTTDIQDFFVQYMINDNLGLIANSHTVLADSEGDLARDSRCVELARLFSVAVDFPKTGEAAVIPRELRPQRYPDFMAKDRRVTYKSERVLGTLYRMVPGASAGMSRFTKADVADAFDEDLMLNGDGFRAYLDEAWNLKKCYDIKLLSLMKQYGIKTEMEAITGNIFTLSKYFAKQRGEVKQRIRLAINSLQKEARRWFRSGYEGSEGYQIDESIELTAQEKLAKASAWYYVSYHPEYVFREGVSRSSKHSLAPLISFPWNVYDSLLAIKKLRS